AACSGELRLTAVGRLDLVEERLNAVIEALQFVSGPLESFYSSLSDGQKRSFDSMTMAARDRGDRSDRGAGASGRLASLCSDRAASFSQLPIDRIEQIIRPSEPQRYALEALQAASARASEELKASCPQTTPQSLPDRLRAVEQRLFAMTTALKTVRPALTDFYGLFSDEQKARVNMMGQTPNEGHCGRAQPPVRARSKQPGFPPPPHRQPTPPRLVLRRAGLALGRAQPVFSAMLDPRLQFRLFDDPPQIFGIVAGNLGETFSAVLAKVKAGVKRRLGRPAHQFAPARSLDQFFEDRGGDDHVESGTVRRDPTAFKTRKRRGASERIAQLLIAVAFEVRPHPQ